MQFEQSDIFQALAHVEANADPRWIDLALGVIERLAHERPVFTTDDVWGQVGEHLPYEPRVLGAVMRKAAHRQWITASPEYRQSSRRECHGRPVRVWRSLVWDAEGSVR